MRNRVRIATVVNAARRFSDEASRLISCRMKSVPTRILNGGTRSDIGLVAEFLLAFSAGLKRNQACVQRARFQVLRGSWFLKAFAGAQLRRFPWRVKKRHVVMLLRVGQKAAESRASITSRFSAPTFRYAAR
jgi:hypothetical protein